ncbi:MAG: hypothetical protein O6944_11020 [Gammaproteobacteria bacterium]|nr:hypothetical protein [Gammaproteobacteria bacterium]
MNNSRGLRAYMAEHKLSYKDVARLCNVTVPTVVKWLHSETSAEYEEMPTNSLDMFVKKLSRGWVKKED